MCVGLAQALIILKLYFETPMCFEPVDQSLSLLFAGFGSAHMHVHFAFFPTFDGVLADIFYQVFRTCMFSVHSELNLSRDMSTKLLLLAFLKTTKMAYSAFNINKNYFS